MKCNRNQITRLAAALLLIGMMASLLFPVNTDNDGYIIAPIRSGEDNGLQKLKSPKPNMRPSYNAGNCKRLAGKPFVMVIYLDDDVSNWTEEEVHVYNERLINPALDFLDDNAAKWGVNLCMKTGYYASYGHPEEPVKYDGVVENFNDGNTSDDILDQAALSLGYASKEDMHDHLVEFAQTEQIAYVVMLDKGGRSYSCPRSGRNRSVTNDYELEYAVVFSGFTDTSRDSASDTIAHELLHLFGAEDYYYPDSRKALAEKYYPEDIMLCAMSDLEYFTLGEYTAYTLGWTDKVPQVCSMEGWWG
jgi:hypothetical protein